MLLCCLLFVFFFHSFKFWNHQINGAVYYEIEYFSDDLYSLNAVKQVKQNKFQECFHSSKTKSMGKTLKYCHKPIHNESDEWKLSPINQFNRFVNAFGFFLCRIKSLENELKTGSQLRLLRNEYLLNSMTIFCHFHQYLHKFPPWFGLFGTLTKHTNTQTGWQRTRSTIALRPLQSSSWRYLLSPDEMRRFARRAK